ncbi:DUF3048 domain-containing protein [Homoserinibacter sp. GY 40078]|uniref:DUF3048 domain-containing protein n=1 Tax=Homoserinibacter sp. GY 40078 TaxID=2603275 RepID=UPI00165077BA|nr:DUF3048 domain-containing protein [Homoserinibacter sp. GY 40078]
MQSRGRRAIVTGLAVVIAIGAAGCTSPEVMPVPTPTPTYTSDYVTPEPVVYAPLTGMPVDDPASIERPSLAAKIDNHWDARPQVGLESTDLVFEELVEGGLTRYMAVWHSHLPKEIGPIRSIRPMDPDIASPLGGIIAYSGGQLRFVALMQQTDVYNAIHGQPDTADVMYRTSSKAAPHNVIVKARELVAAHSDLAAPPQLFAFADSADASTAAREGKAISGVDLVFGSSSQPSWRWKQGVWLRSQDGEPDLDSAGNRLSAVNVVVIRVPVSYGLGVPKTELIGSGEAKVLSGGRIVSATWSKASRTAPIRLVDSTGAVIRLAPGNSWIELVPTSGSVSAIAAK